MAALLQGRHDFERESKGFSEARGRLPIEASDALRRAGLADCRFWAHLVEDEDDLEEVILDTILGLCSPLELEFEDGDMLMWKTLLPELISLTQAAKMPAKRVEGRMARVSDVQIVLDHALRLKEGAEELEKKNHVRLAVCERPRSSREWQPVKYR